MSVVRGVTCGRFALWHLAPGAVVTGGATRTPVGGTALLGAALGWVAHRSGSIRWPVVSHVLAGVAQV